MRLKRPMRLLGGSVRLKRLLGGSVRLKRPKGRFTALMLCISGTTSVGWLRAQQSLGLYGGRKEPRVTRRNSVPKGLP